LASKFAASLQTANLGRKALEYAKQCKPAPQETPTWSSTRQLRIIYLRRTVGAPMIREALRAELKAIKPLDEAWYEPSEVEAMSCGKVRRDTEEVASLGANRRRI
jgi:hypothetical protein